jgi:hypothetical protein
MRIAVTDHFLNDLRDQSKSVQNKCHALLREIRGTSAAQFANSAQPGWRLHRLRSSPFVSVSVDMATRILCKVQGDEIQLHRLLRHDAYEQPHVNQNEQNRSTAAVVEGRIGPLDVFGALCALGVREADAIALRGASTEDALLDALSMVGASVRDLALSLYETSGLVLPRTRLRVLGADDELAAVLEASTAEWEVYLHPSQHFIADAPAGG